MLFDINNFTARIICDSAVTDTHIDTLVTENQLELYITATKDRPRFVELYWDAEATSEQYVLGDTRKEATETLSF